MTRDISVIEALGGISKKKRKYSSSVEKQPFQTGFSVFHKLFFGSI